MDFARQKILIVGASSGIGKATAIDLSRKGAKLVLISRSEDKLKKVYEEVLGEVKWNMII